MGYLGGCRVQVLVWSWRGTLVLQVAGLATYVRWVVNGKLLPMVGPGRVGLFGCLRFGLAMMDSNFKAVDDDGRALAENRIASILLSCGL
jgi:hypothetical protein